MRAGKGKRLDLRDTDGYNDIDAGCGGRLLAEVDIGLWVTLVFGLLVVGAHEDPKVPGKDSGAGAGTVAKIGIGTTTRSEVDRLGGGGGDLAERAGDKPGRDRCERCERCGRSGGGGPRALI